MIATLAGLPPGRSWGWPSRSGTTSTSASPTTRTRGCASVMRPSCRCRAPVRQGHRAGETGRQRESWQEGGLDRVVEVGLARPHRRLRPVGGVELVVPRAPSTSRRCVDDVVPPRGVALGVAPPRPCAGAGPRRPRCPRPPPSASAGARRACRPSRSCRRSRARRRRASRPRRPGRRAGVRSSSSPAGAPRRPASPRRGAAGATTRGRGPTVAPNGLKGSSGRSRLSSRSTVQSGPKCSGSRPSYDAASPTTYAAIRGGPVVPDARAGHVADREHRLDGVHRRVEPAVGRRRRSRRGPTRRRRGRWPRPRSAARRRASPRRGARPHRAARPRPPTSRPASRRRGRSTTWPSRRSAHPWRRPR